MERHKFLFNTNIICAKIVMLRLNNTKRLKRVSQFNSVVLTNLL